MTRPRVLGVTHNAQGFIISLRVGYVEAVFVGVSFQARKVWKSLMSSWDKATLETEQTQHSKPTFV